MGITSRVISGETPSVLGADSGGGTSGDAAIIDVSLYMERVRYQEQHLMRWAKKLIEKWLRKNGKAGIKELKGIKLHFPLTDFEMEQRIKNVFGPMYREGPLSANTYLKMANLRWDNEKANKEDEKDARDNGLLDPPSTFKQTAEVVTPGGTRVSTTESVTSPGSPDKADEESAASTKPAPVM
jgi:hypothetical protein